MQTVLLERMEKMMLEETKSILNEIIIKLHNEARNIQDSEKSLELRKVADEISDIVKRESYAVC